MMFRLLLILALVIVVLAVGADVLLAQGADRWPAFDKNVTPPDVSWRGPGFYLNWLKVLAGWLVFLLWVWTTDWVNRDLQQHGKLNYLHWNPII
jgi:hypothetical protein